MAVFTTKVEIEFTPGSGTWTDVSVYVKGFDTDRGRSEEFDVIEASTGKIIFDNSDGRFTPRKTAGPYYPNIKPRRKLRISSVVGATTTVVFTGWVEKWPTRIDQNGASVVEAPITDALAGAGRRKFTRGFFNERLRSYSPDHYWIGNDPADSQNVQDYGFSAVPATLAKTAGTQAGEVASSGGASLVAVGEASAGGSLSVVKQVGRPNTAKCPYFSSATSAFGSIGGAGNSWAVFGIVDASGLTATPLPGIPGVNAITAPLLVAYDASGGLALNVSLNYASDTGNWTVNVFGSATATLALTLSAAPSGPMPITVSVSAGTLRIRAGSQTTTAASSGSATSIARITVGRPPVSFSADSGTGVTEYSNVALWQSTAPTEIVDGTFQTYAVNSISGGGTIQVDSLMSILALMATDVAGNIGADATLVALPDPAIGTSVLSEIQQTASSVDGIVFAERAGTIKYIPRSSRFAPGAAVLTFKDSTGTAVDAGLLFEDDEARIVNDFTVNREGKPSVSATDAASIAEFDTITDSIDSRVVDDEVALGMAQWRIHLFAQPQVRVNEVGISLTASGINAVTFSQLDIGSRIDLDELPSTAPYTTGKFYVEGIELECSIEGETENWSATLKLSPSDPWACWVIEDAVYGFIDNDNNVIAY